MMMAAPMPFTTTISAVQSAQGGFDNDPAPQVGLDDDDDGTDGLHYDTAREGLGNDPAPQEDLDNDGDSLDGLHDNTARGGFFNDPAPQEGLNNDNDGADEEERPGHVHRDGAPL